MARDVNTESIQAKIAWMVLIALVSTTLGMLALWRAPGLDLYARDLLMRARGRIGPPNDIVILAIDEESITRLGRFPWSRQIFAQTVGIAAAAHPKVIALDVLFSDPTNSPADKALAEAIDHAGNVVSAAQLVADNAGSATWLRPLPAIEEASAAIGHVNVSTELEGTARQILLQESDDRGHAYWAMALQTVRVADGAVEQSIRETGGKLQAGSHLLSVHPNEDVFARLPGNKGQIRQIRARQMIIDYIGPSGSFSPYTVSIADLLEGRIRPAQLQGKYVLIGATAASLGDRLSSPFIHLEGTDARQHGSPMPGVEVLANTLNTILRDRFYAETPDWLAAACAGLIALLVSIVLSLEYERHETIAQVSILVSTTAILLAGSYLLFTQSLVLPPLVPGLVSLAVSAPLTFVRRSMLASLSLDTQVRELSQAETWLWPSLAMRTSRTAALIARLTGAEAVAVVRRLPTAKNEYAVTSAYGVPVLKAALIGNPDLIAASDDAVGPAEQFFWFPPKSTPNSIDRIARKFRVGTDATLTGVLVVACRTAAVLGSEEIRLSIELATASLFEFAQNAGIPIEKKFRPDKLPLFPQRVESKGQALAALQQRLLTRARFVDRTVQSLAEGLIVSGPDGRIVFANCRAADALGVSERSLMGTDLLTKLGKTPAAEREILLKLTIDRLPVEREIAIGNDPRRHYILRLSPVQDDGEARSPLLGWVASLSEVTKERELQQMKIDVMALVTHELRTPLTAIQGISEVLAQFEVDPDRRRQMHSAINEEAKRLAHMIDEYLDLTRLESGAHSLRLASIRVEALVQRILLLLDPVAARRGIAIVRQFPPVSTPVLADPDLMARAVTNVVANAIKYGRPNTEVTVGIRETPNAVEVEVSDQGLGIPQEHLARIFEKFYRVPRVEDAETRGTGLGLAMVREIVERHGGTVTVESAWRKGSTFRLHLPKRQGEAHSKQIND